jgi:hypothetical protein
MAVLNSTRKKKNKAFSGQKINLEENTTQLHHRCNTVRTQHTRTTISSTLPCLGRTVATAARSVFIFMAAAAVNESIMQTLHQMMSHKRQLVKWTHRYTANAIVSKQWKNHDDLHDISSGFCDPTAPGNASCTPWRDDMVECRDVSWEWLPNASETLGRAPVEGTPPLDWAYNVGKDHDPRGRGPPLTACSFAPSSLVPPTVWWMEKRWEATPALVGEVP